MRATRCVRWMGHGRWRGLLAGGASPPARAADAGLGGTLVAVLVLAVLAPAFRGEVHACSRSNNSSGIAKMVDSVWLASKLRMVCSQPLPREWKHKTDCACACKGCPHVPARTAGYLTHL